METSSKSAWSLCNEVHVTLFTVVYNNYHNYRDLVVWLLADIAPGDSQRRRQHRLTRRVYHKYNDSLSINFADSIYFSKRVPIMCGMLMGWINLNHMDLLFMCNDE